MTQRQVELYLNLAPFFFEFVRILNQVFLEFSLFLYSEKV